MLLPVKTTLLPLILLSLLVAHSFCADMQQSGSLQQTSGPAQAPAGETGSTTKAPTGTSDVKPEIPGAKTILLKPGEKPPERVEPGYEDWSKPQLTAGMRAEAMPLARGEGPGFTKELVHLQWRQMDPIDLWLVKPKDVVKPPVILYLYSYPSSNERYKDDKVCEFLTRNGFAAVGFVSALTEQRFHDRPTRDSFINQLQESLGSIVHDVQMILNYLTARRDLDMTRVGMWGDGSGAAIALMAAAVDPRIKALDLLDPWGDWPDWVAGSSLVSDKERPALLSAQFLQSVEDLEPVKWLPALKDRRVRLQEILNGVTVTPATARERIEAAAPARVEIVHYQNTKEFVEQVASAGKGFDWIKKQLGATGDIREAANSKDHDTTKPPSTTQTKDH